MIQGIAITTGGGDAPGLNAVIRAVTLSGLNKGWRVLGIREGFDGLLFPERYEQGGVIELTRDAVRGIAHRGGTILGTTNRGNPFEMRIKGNDGVVRLTDLSDLLLERLKAQGIDAVVSIGGDGSMTIAHQLWQKGARVVGVPKTIDNDLEGTFETFGFESAVEFATECIGRLHSTAESHRRVMVVEVMGRHAGWIALHAGVAGSADVILMPEIPYDIYQVAERINQRNAVGRKFSIVVVAEGAVPAGGNSIYRKIGDVERLGGVGNLVAEQLRELVPNEIRTVVLGHLVRGGVPTANDRLLALRFGAAAVRALDEGFSGYMVALDPPTVRYVPLEECTRRTKTVPLDCDTMLTARALGISFGG